MNAYVILCIMTETLAYESNGYNSNVGTILFTSSDIFKNTWSKNQIALLRARHIFQNFIPSLEMVNNLNENSIDNLISYLKNSYTLVKAEASDQVDDAILSTALSDVIGGYLKVWALPVTRYAFYGGTISSDKVLKLHKFYKEVLYYLKTDGSGWQSPDPNLLRSVEINIAPRHVTNIRCIANPCSNVAFFEKSLTGLSIPMPCVNWNKGSYTMFLPLKNYSLIALKSPEVSDILFKYYDTAKQCIQTSNQDQNTFEEKFQNWISKDVVPHLNDEDLYLAFGGILTLVNKSKSLTDTVTDLYSLNSNNTRNKFSIACLPINITSKKIIIILIIMFLELIWCVPALMYLICVKRKKKSMGDSNVYLYPDSKNSKEKDRNIQTWRLEKDSGTNPDPTSIVGLKLHQKRKRKYTESNNKYKEITVKCPSNSKSTYFAGERYESMHIKPTLKKITNPLSTPSQDVSSSKVNVSQYESYSSVQELEAKKTVSVFKEVDNSNKHTTTCIDIHSNNYKDRNTKNNLKTDNSKAVISVSTVIPEDLNEYICTCPSKEDDPISIQDNKMIIKKIATLVTSCSKSSKSSIKNEYAKEPTKIHIETERKHNKRKAKLSNKPHIENSSNKPYIENKIDREQSDICLELSGNNDKFETKKVAETRPSKIPTRKHAGHVSSVTAKRTDHYSLDKKSMIAELKSRPVDDTEMCNKEKAGNNKRNVTL